MGTGTQELGPSSDAFPEHNHRAELEIEQMGFEQCPYGMLVMQAVFLPGMPQCQPFGILS